LGCQPVGGDGEYFTGAGKQFEEEVELILASWKHSKSHI
jgi:hypothetical protein